MASSSGQDGYVVTPPVFGGALLYNFEKIVHRIRVFTADVNSPRYDRILQRDMGVFGEWCSMALQQK